MRLPFVYIASLRRTGSTVLSEALTRLPHGFIFREPLLGEGKFQVKTADRERWKEHGIDLDLFARDLAADSSLEANAAIAFRDRLLPRLLEVVSQVGVKEIFHDGWRRYARAFPGMKVLLTGRDPRDLYLSLHARIHESGGKRWPGRFHPESAAADLNRQFRFQFEMFEDCDCMKVRYEDLCTDPGLFDQVKRFCESPIPGIGDIGSFNASNPKRIAEYELHRDQITDQRIGRWKREPDEALRSQAGEIPALMPEYCRFWGYD
ncbi:MAG: sulfotransferase [Planctomycetota bacterium]